MFEKEILVSGIPRSGTSLLMKLLSSNPQNICFSEPSFIKHIKLGCQTKAQVKTALSQEIKNIRYSIKDGKPVTQRISKQSGSQLPDNYFKRQEVDGKTVVKKTSGEVQFILDKDKYDKTIVVKNNLLFSACIDQLSEWFKCIVVIRNPVATVCSWNSLDMPISRGVVTSGMKYSDSLKMMATSSDLMIKQLQIYDWFCYKYRQSKKHIELIKYEDLIQHPERVLNLYLSDGESIKTLKSQNQNAFYSQKIKHRIEALIKQKEYKNLEYFYPKVL